MKSCLAILALAFAGSACAQLPLTLALGAGDQALPWDYAGTGIESRCGSDWFFLAAEQWTCVRRNGAGALGVISAGLLPEVLDGFVVVRPPLAADRRLLMAGPVEVQGTRILALDPVNLAVEDLGRLPPGGYPNFPFLRVDVEGDGVEELLLTDSPPLGSRLVSLPTSTTPSQVVRTLAFIPLGAGQFDSDPQSELVTVDALGELTIRDASSLQVEPFSIPGSYFDNGVLVRDWDSDGIAEIALRSRSFRIVLVDVNRPGLPIELPVNDHALDLIDWQAAGSLDLLLWSPGMLRVFDPRTGSLLSEVFVPRVGQELPRHVLRMDWDNDGDRDLVWPQLASPNSLWLVRNNGGVSELQAGASYKHVAGEALVGGHPRLVTVEGFLAENGIAARLRTRDPATLELQTDVALAGADINARFAVADFHPADGVEVIAVAQTHVRLHDLSGALLWERPIELPFERSFRNPVFVDASCQGAGCRRLLLLDRAHAASGVHRLRLFDTATGNQSWSLDAPLLHRFLPLGLTDLDTDGVPELLYADEVGGNSTILALDGVSSGLRWQTEMLTRPIGLRQTFAASRRLALLFADGAIAWMRPQDGEFLRVAPVLNPGQDACGESCDFVYLGQGSSSGAFVTSNLQGRTLATRWRDLRGPIWSQSRHAYISGLAPFADGRVVISSGFALYAYDAADDGLHADEFEGW